MDAVGFMLADDCQKGGLPLLETLADRKRGGVVGDLGGEQFGFLSGQVHVLVGPALHLAAILIWARR
ncbi:hypothetical protein RFN57_01945 [Streptomyces violaceochromogenes]|uniref:Uncharacterized protein n=1 Tax=Streptomyces violaceochromogenes TaxID=67377 RepID=A0ABU6LNX5_9ACTN|nr:hypothetical protein [Streptomyces violaceochromogenes]MEC7051078.1 hypothetical protein [Streptomyces violaceochromogenes]